MQPHRIFSLGDSALTVDFGNCISEAVNKKVLQLFHQLQGASPHIIDLIPAYSSLTVCYNTRALRTHEQTAFDVVKALVGNILLNESTVEENSGRQLRIPVCYNAVFAPDLEDLARQRNLSPGEVVHLHTATTYRVFMLGFLPGFAYMGTVNSRIAAPRKATPRTLVPAGAVGIAGEQTGIYPLPSPGGWNLIGQTPLPLFDAKKQSPALLQPGDEVQFYSITRHEFERY